MSVGSGADAVGENPNERVSTGRRLGVLDENVESSIDIGVCFIGHGGIAELGGDDSLADRGVGETSGLDVLGDDRSGCDEIATLLDTLVEIGVGKHLGLQAVDFGILLGELAVFCSDYGDVRGVCRAQLGAGIRKQLLQRCDNRGTLIGYFNRDGIDGNRLQGHDRFLCRVVIRGDGADAPIRTVTDASL